MSFGSGAQELRFRRLRISGSGGSGAPVQERLPVQRKSVQRIARGLARGPARSGEEIFLWDNTWSPVSVDVQCGVCLGITQLQIRILNWMFYFLYFLQCLMVVEFSCVHLFSLKVKDVVWCSVISFNLKFIFIDVSHNIVFVFEGNRLSTILFYISFPSFGLVLLWIPSFMNCFRKGSWQVDNTFNQQIIVNTLNAFWIKM